MLENYIEAMFDVATTFFGNTICTAGNVVATSNSNGRISYVAAIRHHNVGYRVGYRSLLLLKYYLFSALNFLKSTCVYGKFENTSSTDIPFRIDF